MGFSPVSVFVIPEDQVLFKTNDPSIVYVVPIFIKIGEYDHLLTITDGLHGTILKTWTQTQITLSQP